jgi:TonB family protein
MALGLPPPSIVFSAVLTLTVIEPATAGAQDTTSRQNACRIIDNLKTTKTVFGVYTDEATRKGVEGIVVLCVTVDGNGRVLDINALSGPSELLQPSIDAAKQWQFEPPPKAPAATKTELRYSLTKPCPNGGKGMDGGEITVDIGTGHSIEDEQGDAWKILGKVYQPLPPYPEKARAEWRRGQLYLSIVVNPDGRVVDARIVKSLDEVLAKLALDTVRTWPFNVAPGGKPTVFRVTLSFQIPCLDHR